MISIVENRDCIALYDWIYKNYLPNGGKVLDTDYYLAEEQRFSNYIAQTNLFNTDTVITEQLCL